MKVEKSLNTGQYKITLMQNCFLNYYFYLKLGYYKQQQPF